MTLLVFGMDGACREYVEEAIDRGLMPNLEELKKEGAFGEMDSVVPPITIPAWPCMFSGYRADRFDAFNLLSMDRDYEIGAQERTWHGDMLWDRIQGSFGVLSVPGEGGRPLNGFMVGGFPLTAESFYPPELEKELEQPEPIDLGEISTREGRREGEFQNFEKERELYSSVEREVDVRVEVFQLTDNAAHRSKTLEEVLETYGKVDEVLGERMEEYNDILLVSDHGFTQVDSYFYVNTWLRENGYLEEQNSSGRSLKHRLQSLAAPLADTPLRPFLKKMKDILKQKAGADFGFNAESPENIDYENTGAFCFQGSASHYGGIWVNDERWSSPVVGDREAKAEEIKQQLSGLDVIENAWLREEVYERPEGMPDIIFETSPETGVGVSLFPKTVVGTNAFIHSFTGIVGAWGESFRSGEVEDAEIIDVAPTIARYLGQELDCDGEVLDVFVENFEPKKPSSEELSGLDF